MTNLAVILILLVGLGIYFMPTIIGALCKHHNAAAIFLLNLLLGWTFLGWVAAFIWSVTKRPQL